MSSHGRVQDDLVSSSGDWEPPILALARRVASLGPRLLSGALLGVESALLLVAVAVAGFVAVVDVAALRIGYPPVSDQDWSRPVPLIVVLGTPAVVGLLLVLRRSRRPWVRKVALVEGVILATSPVLGVVVLVLTA